MTVVAFEEDELRLICRHAPQCVRKTFFCDQLTCEWDMHSASDLFMCWETLMDTLVGILMDLMGFMEGGHRQRNMEG